MTPEQTQAYLLWLNKGSPPGSLGDAFLGGPVAPIQGATIVNTIADLKARQNLSDGDNFLILGYWTIGDAPVVLYQYSAASSASDNGGTVIAPTAGSGRFLAGSALAPDLLDWPNTDVRNWGSVSSSFATTGTMSASSALLTLAAAGDFINGQPIVVLGAGANCAVGAPTGVAAVTEGPTGATTYYYKVCSVDNSCGISAASTAGFTTAGDGNAILGGVMDLGAAAQFQTTTWTAPTGTIPSSYIVYVSRDAGSTYAFQGVSVNTTWNDYGQTQTRPDWVPALPPSSAIGQVLSTTISSGAGTVSLSLADTATNAVTSGVVVHDSTNALTACLANGNDARLPGGILHITQGLTLSTSGQSITGLGSGACTITGRGAFDLVVSTAAGTTADTIADLYLECINMVGGYGFTLDGGNLRVIRNIKMNQVYNGFQITGAVARDVIQNIRIAGTDVRGDVSIYIWSYTGHTGTTDIYHVFDVPSYSASALIIDGNVQTVNMSTFGLFPKERRMIQVIDSQSAGPPKFLRFQDFGINDASQYGMYVSDARNIFISALYCQGHVGNATDLVFMGSNVFQVVVQGSEIFGAGVNGINFGGAGLDVSGSLIFDNLNAAINIASTANGVTVNGGGSLNYISGNSGTHGTYGIYINPLATNIRLSGTWIGTQENIHNPLIATDVRILGDGGGQAIPNSVSTSSGPITLSVASFPNLYTGAGARLAVIDMSGATADATVLTTDTAANIIAVSAGYAVVGATFTFRVINHAPFTLTMAGGTGVTVSGKTIGAAAAAAGSTNFRDFVGIVTNASSAITIVGQ